MTEKDVKIIDLKNAIEVIRNQVALMPNQPGIYKMIGYQGKILYVGKAKILPKRVISYANYEKLVNRLRRMVAQIQTIEYITTNTEAEALLLEANLIKSLKPVYNICLRDDKSFPYIFIDENHTFPRITKYRGKKDTKGSYFGPFASAGSVNQTITELQKLFLIRPCTNSFFESRQRPCLQYQIKRCSGPCANRISEKDYLETISHTKDFLAGKSSLIQERLSKQMEQASIELRFENAAEIRDRIKNLTAIQAKNTIADIGVSDVDIIVIYKNQTGQSCVQIFFIRGGKSYGNRAYFQDDIMDVNEENILETFIGQFYQNKQIPKGIYLNKLPTSLITLSEALSRLAKHKVALSKPLRGAKADLINFALSNAKEALEKMVKEKLKHSDELEKLVKLFNLHKVPKRIEVYDNSHTQGTNAVGARVVYTENGFEKSQYRKYNIREVAVGDDYEMLREVLTRRLKKLDESNYPDILLIDGGKGHLSTAHEILEKFKITDIKIVCIGKGVDRNAGRETFYIKDQTPFQMNYNDKLLHFLQILRDEVHRYAIKTHQERRGKEIRKSIINLIPGIGHFRKKMLLQHFGSADAVTKASIEDLAKVKGINVITAKNIFNYLHQNMSDLNVI